MMPLFKPRLTYAPIEYPKALDYFEKQVQAHWVWSEISLASDINDWSQNLTESEKRVIANTLKAFTTTEIVILDFWSTIVANRFKIPEITSMAVTFSAMEAIHAKAYAQINESLGLEDYEAFMADPTTKARLDSLMAVKHKTKKELARSLAVFSAFAEGVILFSSFAILMNFSRFNKMKGLGQIIAYSSKDESCHSEAGCWLFRQLIIEHPELLDDELKKEIYEAARLAVRLEDDYIDSVFELGAVEGLDPADLKQFIRFRANVRLADLGLKANWKNLDKEAVKCITDWYDPMVSGVILTDFFATKPVEYSRGVVNWDTTFDEEPSNE